MYNKFFIKKMIKPYTSEFFENYLKFDNDANKEMKSLIKNDMKLKDFIQVFKKLKSIRKKKTIRYSVIKTFYEQPEKFFGDYHKILENSTFFDYAGNSIFYHLFYVLYVDYKRRNNIGVLNDNEKNLNFQIYESKFESFLKEYEKYFLLQDVVLDTPLHKIAKRRDKGFFIELYQKLNKINLISKESLLINNISNETICTYVLNEIKYNLSKIKNEEFYYNFINNHLSMYESFSKDDQKILKNFSLKITFEKKQYKNENFNDIFNSLNDFINNNINASNLFEFIYFPFTTNINYLNSLFFICSKDEDYNKLFDLVSKLSQKEEIINKICVSELCIVDHIKCVIRKMGLYNRKFDQVHNYGIKLIKEILSNIVKSKDEKGIKKLIGHKKFKKGLISNIIYNQSLSFDIKIELFDLLSEITKGISNKYIEKKTYSLYRFFKLCEKEQISKSNIENDFINKVLDINKYLEPLLVIDFYARNKDDNFESDTYISEKIKTFFKFLNKNYYNLFKYAYNLSDEKVEKILNAIFVYNKKYDYEIESYMAKLNKDHKNLVKSFILSDRNLIDYYFNEWLKNGNIKFIEYLFSSESDLSCFIDFNNQNFKNLIFNNHENYKNIYHFNAQTIKGKPFEDKYLAFLFILSGITKNIKILFPINLNNIYEFFIANFIYLFERQIFEFWNYPFDYIELTKFINAIILPFSFLFIKKKEMFKGIMKEIAPNIDIEVYLRAMDIAVNACKKCNVPESALDHGVEEKLINRFYLIFILIYIKKKYESQTPNLSVLLRIHLLRPDYAKIIDFFENSFKKRNISNILNYFYFFEACCSDEKYNIVDYLRKNNDSFCKILKMLKGKCYQNYENYLKYIKPHLRGYAFLDENNESKIIPYRKYTDFDEFLDYHKKYRTKRYFNIRVLTYFDIKKRPNSNEEDNFNFNFICNKLFEEGCYIADMLYEPNEKMNKHLYKKIISIIDYMSKEVKNKECECNEFFRDDMLNNLYELFACIEEEKKTFFDILNNNKLFITITSNTFDSALFHLYFGSIIRNDMIKMKKREYIVNKIFEFYKMENEDKYLSKLLEYNEKEFFNSFFNKIKQMKNKDKESIKKQYELFLKINNKTNYIHLYIKSIGIFFENNEEYFYNCLSCNINLFKGKNKDKLDALFRNLMNKNVEKFINCIPELNNLFGNNLNLKNVKNSIINNIIKSKKYELFFNQNIKNHTNIFSDFYDSLHILNFSENNNNASKYIMNKIKELFCQNDDNQLFIGFLRNSIINQYVFDTTLKIISKKNDKNFVDANKSIIFESLNEYCIKNAHYYVDNLLTFLKDYLSLEEIKNRIFTYDFSEKANFANTNQKKESESNNAQDEENKYLLLNCLNNFKKNYETIAVLLNYYPSDRIYLYIFPFLYDINIDILLVYEYSKYMDYFSKSKNRDIIKSLNKNFYNISIFLESLRNQYNYISSLPKKVQNLFNYYISINILQIIPRDLLCTDFYNFDNEEMNKVINQREELLKRCDLKKIRKSKFKDRISELDLFMIFALYEIKGTPLVPIRKYLPEFYLKVENYCKIFKSLNIPEICLKDSFDVRFIDNYLINNLKNQKVKILKKIEKFSNLIFIIQKEYGNIFDISESNEDIYYQQLIYNLIENTNICSFIDDEKKVNDYYKDLDKFRIGFNLYFDSLILNMEKNFIQETIFSLKDFTRSSSLIIKQSSYYELYNNYSQYLNIIKSICSYFINQSSNTFENKDKNSENNLNFSNYDIFILKEVLFQNENDKIAALKSTINIKQIKYFIIEYIKNNTHSLKYIDLAINWLDDYLKLNHISKMFNDLSQISLVNYFNYLSLCCEIIINWLRTIFYELDRLNGIPYYFHIRFKNNTNEENAKEELGESLYILGSSFLKNNNNYDNLPMITISYYLDENMNYVETTSGQYLFEFTKDKCNSLDLFIDYLTFQNEDNNDKDNEDKYNKHKYNKYKYNDFKDNQLYLINKAINAKNIRDLYELLFSNKRINKKDKNLFNVFKPLFESIFAENKNFILSYMKETAVNTNEPNQGNCLSLIKYKFSSFFSNYIIPCLLFNYNLRKFSEDISYFGKTCYKIYIDFNEIINSINRTKYHNNKKLNELFKIKAINYVINGDSTVRLHIEELYKYIKNSKKGIITDTFVVKVVDGKEVKNEFNNLKMTLDSNNSINDFLHYSRLKPIKSNNNAINNKTTKKLKLKLKLKNGEQNSRNSMINENIHFSTYKKNNYKRKNIPSLSYEGHVPSMQFIAGKTKGMILNNVFRNEYLKRDIKVKDLFNTLGLNENPRKKFPGRKHFDYREKFVNVFDLIFSIKSISKNEIIVCQNNISSVLEEYYEPNTFMSLLNYGFHDKKEKEVQLNINLIEKYINENI